MSSLFWRILLPLFFCHFCSLCNGVWFKILYECGMIWTRWGLIRYIIRGAAWRFPVWTSSWKSYLMIPEPSLIVIRGRVICIYSFLSLCRTMVDLRWFEFWVIRYGFVLGGALLLGNAVVDSCVIVMPFGSIYHMRNPSKILEKWFDLLIGFCVESLFYLPSCFCASFVLTEIFQVKEFRKMEYLFGLKTKDFVILAADQVVINQFWFLKKGKTDSILFFVDLANMSLLQTRTNRSNWARNWRCYALVMEATLISSRNTLPRTCSCTRCAMVRSSVWRLVCSMGVGSQNVGHRRVGGPILGPYQCCNERQWRPSPLHSIFGISHIEASRVSLISWNRLSFRLRDESESGGCVHPEDDCGWSED